MGGQPRKAGLDGEVQTEPPALAALEEILGSVRPAEDEATRGAP
jgi:hypothetical protein